MSDDEKPSLETTEYESPPAYPGPSLTHDVPPRTHYMPPPTLHMQTSATIMTPTVSVQPGYSTTANIMMTPAMGKEPAQHTCPSCQQVIVTRVEKNITMKTHMIALMCCLVCLWPCALIPYFTNTCRNIEHYCPNCNAYIGFYQH